MKKGRATMIDPAQHLGMAGAIAAQIKRDVLPFAEYADLYGWALVGLCEAAKRFDPSKGAAFSTFAYIRIRGRIFDAYKKTVKRGPLTDYIGDRDFGDSGKAQQALENKITARQLLKHLSPSERRFMVVTCSADNDASAARAARLPKATHHRRKMQHVNKLRNILAEEVAA
jgi:RNA polymerase sigma factor (sigma-70 family)